VTEEPYDLQRLLQDQPGTKPADHLDRVQLAGHTSQRLIQLSAKPLARGYLLHAVTIASTCHGQSAGYVRNLKSPDHETPPEFRFLYARLACKLQTVISSE
jgi:hypothetical protein